MIVQVRQPVQATGRAACRNGPLCPWRVHVGCRDHELTGIDFRPWRLRPDTVCQRVKWRTPELFLFCQKAADLDRDQRRHVRDCEAVAGNELLSAQFAIHPFETLIYRSLFFAIFRELPEAALKDRDWCFAPCVR